MGISIFPTTAAEFVENNFVIDMNDTNNNTADTGGIKDAGPYGISLSTGDTSFDIYLIDVDGNNVGYSNGTSITASAAFDTVVILGVATDEIITFAYAGSVNNADGFGDEPGAGAFLTSITPTDLPSIDDTATITGGNFATDVEITFESGATVLAAKSITRNSETELLVTRPDALIEDDAPYTVRAVNVGVPQPTGSNANLLVDEVTAGSDPTFITTTLNTFVQGEAFSQTIEASDAEGTITSFVLQSGLLPTGVSLATGGLLSGTPTAPGDTTVVIRATDDGGNITDQSFSVVYALATGGSITADGTTTIHTFETTGTFSAKAAFSADYLIVAGGGGGGSHEGGTFGSGGGGAGGLITTEAAFRVTQAQESVTIGDFPVVVGAAGLGATWPDVSTEGNDSSVFSKTALGGGRGGNASDSSGVGPAATNGGSGGGSLANSSGNGTTLDSAQGTNGGTDPGTQDGATGGGANTAGEQQLGGGVGFTLDGIEYARGGRGTFGNTSGSNEIPTQATGPGSGGNGRRQNPPVLRSDDGRNGIVIIKYEVA